MKNKLRNTAVWLRRKGLSYSTILKKVPVARSTLSLWLRSVNLSKSQKQRLTNKKLEAAKRGAESRKRQKLETIKRIKEKAKLDIRNIKKNDLWLMGIMLYWAEGSKEKEYGSGQNIIFSNSDPKMIKLFLKWLKMCLNVSDERLIFHIYLHENYKERKNEILEFWRKITLFSSFNSAKIYYKKNKITTNRKNKGKNYHGLLRITVRKSSDLNREIAGWIEGICLNCGVV